MKRIFVTLVAVFTMAQFSYAQWTPDGSGNYSLTSGNVGIGTTNFSSLLTLGSSSTRGTLNVAAGSDVPAISISDMRSGGHQYTLYGGVSNVGNLDIYDQTAGAYRFTLNSFGNVGIGTSSPSSLLTIGGSSTRGVERIIGTPSNAPVLVLDNTNASGGTAWYVYAGNNVASAFSIENTVGNNFVLASNGYVGIGTASPAFKLDVSNTINVTASSSTGIAYQFDGTAYGGKKWAMGDGTTVNGTFAIRDVTAGVDRFSINTSGYVGIGTTAPTYQLEVKAPYTGAALGIIGRTSDDASLITFYNSAKTTQMAKFTANTIGFNLDVNQSTALTVLNSGYVGIGTTIPDAKLAVLGTIHANEVKVDLSVPGPDYVFEHDYKLTNLDDLKAYVDKNHHLPEILSAAQMAKDGLNLGDMNIKLLKKVEELTLYSIEQNKQLTEQNKQITEQNKEATQQNKQIAGQQKQITNQQQQLDFLKEEIVNLKKSYSQKN